jgi:hypothetical protein
MIYKVLNEIELKTPSGIKKLYAGNIFETFDLKSAAYLIKSRKIKLISTNKILIEQSPQSPQCLQLPDKQEDFPADIEFTISIKSLSDTTHNTVPLTSRDPHTAAAVWSDNMMDLICWLENSPRIQEPFRLDEHRLVCNPVKFYDSLMQEIQTGPSCPRNRNGALMEDLQKLKEIVNEYSFDFNNILEKR